MDKLLETYTLLRPNCGEIENRLMTSKEIETVIKKISQQTTPQDRELHWQILPNIQRRLIHFLLKLFQKVEEEGKHPNILQS